MGQDPGVFCPHPPPPHPKTRPALAEIEAAKAAMPEREAREKTAAETVEKIFVPIGQEPDF